MEKKYELTNESIKVGIVTLYRIKALRSFNDVTAGDLGGFIEKEDNLSHEGNAWVYDNARVFGNALVYGNARVYGIACICCNAKVYDNARVCDKAWVFNNAQVYGNAHVYGNTQVFSNAQVFGNAQVCGDVCINDHVYITNNAIIKNTDDYVYIKGFGSENKHATFYRSISGDIIVVCGCFNGTLDEFINRITETHGDNKYAKEYLAAIDLVKTHFNKGE